MDAEDIMRRWQEINRRAHRPENTIDRAWRDAEIQRLTADAQDSGEWTVRASRAPGCYSVQFESRDGTLRLDAHYRDAPNGRSSTEIACRDPRHSDVDMSLPIGWSPTVEIRVGRPPNS